MVLSDQKLWVFAGYDGSKRWALANVLANQTFLYISPFQTAYFHVPNLIVLDATLKRDKGDSDWNGVQNIMLLTRLGRIRAGFLNKIQNK
jgi:hypothetical protein